jgi:hypothetical protein
VFNGGCIRHGFDVPRNVKGCNLDREVKGLLILTQYCLFVCFPGVTTHCGFIFTAR